MWLDKEYNDKEYKELNYLRKAKTDLVTWAMLYEEMFWLIWAIDLSKEEFLKYILFYANARFLVEELHPSSVEKIKDQLDLLYESLLSHDEAKILLSKHEKEVDLWDDHTEYEKYELAQLSDSSNTIDKIYRIIESDPHVVSMNNEYLANAIKKDFCDDLSEVLN